MKELVNFVAYNEATPEVYNRAEESLRACCPSINFERTTGDADIIYFISGGSERAALQYLKPGKSALLLAGSQSNSWAAATEVKAYSNQNNINTELMSFDSPELELLIVQHLKAQRAIKRLSGQKIGLVGEVSDWLISSNISAETFKSTFGVELLQLPYSSLPDYLSFDADPQFLETFPGLNIQREELASISSFIKDTIAKHQLDAITIQCFKMVHEKHVTACLPVALCNCNGVPTGCEGDLVSVFSIMLLKELLGQVGWMANLAAVQQNSVFLAHCTVPLQLASSFTIPTHYETNESAAICADLDMDKVTIFRLNNQLDQAFVAEGNITAKPNRPGACRTQLEVGLSKNDLNKLTVNPLGNHHIVVKGHHASLICTAMRSKGITLV